MAKRTIQHQAAKGQHLTLDEIAAWVQEAMRAGADAPMRPIDQPR